MHEVIEKIKSHENCKCQESKFMRKNKNESYKKSKYFLTGLKNWAHVMNDLTINSHETFGVHIIYVCTLFIDILSLLTGNTILSTYKLRNHTLEVYLITIHY